MIAGESLSRHGNNPARHTARALNALAAALGDGRLVTEAAVLALYAADDTPHRCVPLAVAFPHSHAEVVALVRAAYRHCLPLVARGAGSGNVGGALPVTGAVVVSFECMTRVLDFNAADRTIAIETGAVTGDIDRLARTAGLFYPPDPGSAAFCRIGGNIAMNAAGPRTLKYGATRDYVLGLRAVDGRGHTLRVGGGTSKGAVGYDLARLLVGSEGTLALITEATLRLIPAPATVCTVRACYASTHAACAAVGRVMAAGCAPTVLEFVDAAALAAIRDAGAAGDLPPARALLIAETDGDAAAQELERVSAALHGPGLTALDRGLTQVAIDALWAARRALSGAVKRMAPRKINEDVVVPVSRLGTLVQHIELLAAHSRLPIVCFGHAGNGNLHVNIMVDPAHTDQLARAEACLQSLFRFVVAHGGRLSGEHGIGSEKRRFLPLEIGTHELALMRAIKGEFDPRGILNPGKLFPDTETACRADPAARTRTASSPEIA